MSRKARAAICRELNKPVVVEEITVDPPKSGEVTVKLAACGVCHSDLSATNGTLAMQLPLILGHEAAGEVIEVGENVPSLSPGDHVVSSFIYMCGECRFCLGGRPVLCIEQGRAITTLPDGTVRTRDARGNPLNIFSGCGVMAEYATLHQDNLVKIDPKIPLDRAALVGCAVTTGVGAVFNTAHVAPGSSVAVFGCGGVGLNVIQGARIAGAERIIAIDTLEAKLDMAKQFGATDGLLFKEDPAKALKKMTGGGLPSEIWARFMKNAHRNVPIASLPGVHGGIALPYPGSQNYGQSASMPLGSIDKPVPPGSIPGRATPASASRNDGMDSWLLDRLLGRR